LIDIQDGFDSPYWGKRNNPDAEKNARRLLDAWRASKLPIFHVQHRSTEENSPLRPDSPGCAFKQIVAPGENEPVIGKQVNSAFIGTDLEKRLREQKITTLVIAGISTDHCVSTSTRMAGNFGFTVFLASDATHTFNRKGPDGREWTADEIHSSALASLHGEFATVMSTSEILGKLSELTQAVK
jgi:nicotinamidase-related amidase